MRGDFIFRDFCYQYFLISRKVAERVLAASQRTPPVSVNVPLGIW